MILPMKKIVLLCLARERAAALEKLAALGVVHIEESVHDAPSVAAAADAIEAAECARDCIAEARRNRKPLSLALRAAKTPGPEGPVATANRAAAAYLAAAQDRTAILAAAKRYAPWGDFDPEAAKKLAAGGIPVSLFTAPVKAEMPSVPGAKMEVLSADKELAYGVLIGAELPEGLQPVALPAESLGSLRRRLAETEKRMSVLAGEIAEAGRDPEALAGALRSAQDGKVFALASANLLETGSIAHLEGWVPAERLPELQDAAKANAWALASRDPDLEAGEQPPTLLRPPRLFRPILTLMGGLGILPGYTETDICVPFYAFFTIFFAMLVGDTGYGAILLAIWFLANRAMKKKARAKGVPPPAAATQAMTLLLVFTIATIVWGVLTGTYFGIPYGEEDPDHLFGWLPAALTSGNPVAAWLSDQGNIMWLCFTIGLVHLEIARIWNVIQLAPDSKALAELGWAGVVFSMYNIVCMITVPDFVLHPAVLWIMGVSVLLIFLFTYKKHELKANVVSLCMTPLNVVSSMGDIISYVRLFAVSLAAVKIAGTFDTMAASLAMPLFVKIPCMLLILLLGHALNFAMSALSILVHAVRLNTLEFSTAKGISWSGAEYAPFGAKRD